MLKGDSRALAGPFEDLPALMVVSIGAAVLLASLANAFLAFEEDNDTPEELLDDFVSALKSYNKLTTGQGIFSADKLGALNATLVSWDLNVACDFRLEFCERSSYNTENTFTTQTADLPDIGQEAVLSRAVPIGIAYSGTVHAGTLTVTIWGYD